jgi:glycosyltransferase involved in cell wall biosynthesis
MSEQHEILPGTIVWIAPFYNRSGYGMQARSFVMPLHKAGVRIRIVPVDEVEPGVDDCDLTLLKSMESTFVVPPITVIISHVVSNFWLGLKFPEPNLRIISTTFDGSAQGNLPPADWIDVCNKLDQVWLMTEKEREVFISAGVPPGKIKTLCVPHLWLDNSAIPAPTREMLPPDKPFRFLCIAMFLPRRRWDTLIEAYLEEFHGDKNVELYLKVNYPSWHPVPGKPRLDLLNLVEALRRKTGSEAAIIIDEDLGTRHGIVRLIDSCNVYVSTDTAHTAPVSEAIVRERLTIFPAGLGVYLPDTHFISIPADPAAKTPLTPEMLLYQPHHRDTFMPRLQVSDVRNAMRRAYEMPPEERHSMATAAATYMFTPAGAVPATVAAIEAGWQYKADMEKEAGNGRPRVTWEGNQLVTHSLSLINRELCMHLIDAGYEVSLIPGREVDNISPDSDPRFEKIVQRTHKPLSGPSDVHVRHHWPPNFDPPPEGHWVMIQPWEYGRLPESWVRPMAELVDEMWVPSRHVQKTYVASGIPSDRVQVIPNGVDSARFNPSAQKYAINSEKKFKFLFVGVAIWRKGVDLLLDAYRSTFDWRDGVVLVIKDLQAGVFYLDQGAGRIIREIRKDPGMPEIVHIETALGPGELPGLYTACDCMVHPYRAEGFAMPVLEAMACGIPVITTAGGSTDDFCSPDDVSLIPARRIEFNPSDVKLATGGGWVLEPDVNALKTLMREAFENNSEAKQRALQVSEEVRGRYDWSIIAEKVAARIDELTQMPVRRKNG